MFYDFIYFYLLFFGKGNFFYLIQHLKNQKNNNIYRKKKLVVFHNYSF